MQKFRSAIAAGAALFVVSAAGEAQLVQRTAIPRASATYPATSVPAGMCRIWIDGLPAARQPAPTDCNTARSRVPANGRIIYGRTAQGPVYGSNGRYDPRRDPRASQYDPRLDRSSSRYDRRYDDDYSRKAAKIRQQYERKQQREREQYLRKLQKEREKEWKKSHKGHESRHDGRDDHDDGDWRNGGRQDNRQDGRRDDRQDGRRDGPFGARPTGRP